MKPWRGTYGEHNIHTPPLDSHFRTRATTPKSLSLVDGVDDVPVESTKVDELATSGVAKLKMM